jgi:regulator of replication initiation timing
MSWNIFKRVAALEVRVLVAESNAGYLHKELNEAMTRIRALELNAPKSLSEAEVKKRLRAAAYSRNYYKMKKAASAAKDTP